MTAEIQRAHTRDETPDLHRWNLVDANLTSLDLTGADLTSANLTRANLTGSWIANAELTRANLTDANLTGAHLLLSRLRATNLTNANLHNTELHNATYDPAQLLTTRGLNPFNETHCIPQETWDQILPTHPTTRELLEELLNDWDGTLQQAISTTELLHTA